VAAMTALQSTPPPRPPAPPAPPVVAAPFPPVARRAPAPARLLAQVQEAPAPVPAVTPYARWVIEDVAYIIRDDERAAFKSLQSDPEREHFIEQFWLRRDPTPGTPENEFKEEHYRRIAYANEQYAAAIPGWKTDRGRIYISYGPPDEKESHRSGPNAAASEQWLYHYIEGVGTNVVIEFIDRNGNGEYRMTTDPAAIAMSRAPGDRPVTNADTLKAGATVQRMGPGAALISIPLTGYAGRRINVTARVVTAQRRMVQSFEDSVQSTVPVYTRVVALATGSYRLEVAVKDITTGKLAADTIEFEVK